MNGPVLSRVALGRVVAAARTAAGMSQEALGRVTGIGQTAVSRIETGQRRLDSVELVHVAEALGVEVAELLAEAKKQTRDGDGPAEPPTPPYDAVASLLGEYDRVTAEAFSWVPPFLARLEELERLALDG